MIKRVNIIDVIPSLISAVSLEGDLVFQM